MTRLMTVAEVAARLNASESFVYGLIADGRLRHFRLGKRQGGIRVGEDQFLEYLAANEQGGERLPPVRKPTTPPGRFSHLPPS